MIKKITLKGIGGALIILITMSLVISFAYREWKTYQIAQSQWELARKQSEVLEEQISQLSLIQEAKVYSELHLQYFQQMLYHYPTTMHMTRALEDALEQLPQVVVSQGALEQHVFENMMLDEVWYEVSMPTSISQGRVVLKELIEDDRMIKIHGVTVEFLEKSAEQIIGSEQVMMKIVFSVFNQGVAV